MRFDITVALCKTKSGNVVVVVVVVVVVSRDC